MSTGAGTVSRADDLGAAIGPRTELETQLLDLWCDWIPVRPLGVTDQLFTLGGDSLIAVRLVAAAQRRYGVRIDRARLFASFTIAAMAALVDKAMGETNESTR